MKSDIHQLRSPAATAVRQITARKTPAFSDCYRGLLRLLRDCGQCLQPGSPINMNLGINVTEGGGVANSKTSNKTLVKSN
jgi:hypothetical protein